MTKFNDAFWKWFGDSKVVDARGNPLVVYHGSRSAADLKKFSRRSFRYVGIYFSADADYASSYAENEQGYGGVIPAYVSIQNPFIIEMPPWDGAIIIKKKIDGFYRELTETIVEKLEKLGYDGILAVANETLPSGRKPVNPFEVVAFSPTQIKSAIGNDGSWDADDADIRSNPLRTWIVDDSKKAIEREMHDAQGETQQVLGPKDEPSDLFGEEIELIPVGDISFQYESIVEHFCDYDFKLIKKLSKAMREGKPIPPVTVWESDDRTKLVSGRHRMVAAIQLGIPVVPALVMYWRRR